MESMFRNTEYSVSAVAERLNSATAVDVHDAFGQCLDVPRWISAMASHLPFADDEAVGSAVFSAAEPLTSAEIERALLVHPRIGERPDGDDAHAAHARGEQSGVDGARRGIRRQLREGNVAYEKRFGHVFLIRAAGRDASEILAALGDRLGNDPDTEIRIVERELREIAVLRIARVLNND
ncbi:2-oxo-4-hydroxy-4-carboxy-5-ureidoimidazoline decarboxylase [Rhodococcus sp. G-MC3]|uniref:2-oxo-4-hydroxy-4-carboxy-5-ureidoimidazoline decarboxylase n=1 Tax=Rhodococcus sp. G-MC3 TaxID=3046209 RepID=UPI0024BB237B|nr:2-oxo-4-hydroxy-4-carboxy-5-ureidoimidazoline decarboxylase [Rhodococcus sp. G-MC3]MDJ0394430.1 2-oxo-4-hydroxy-4-carboxy-5-ureidoimidazoline decarboxylase [Rhodococcus sp. G-MC3]